MEEIKESTNICFAKNLSKQNINTLISVPIDTNVNIKTILNINTYIFDEKVECSNGKAIVNGKIGLKVLYIDTDNITNTLIDSQPFSETIIDNSISSDCFINLTNISVVNNIISSDSTLKINCDITFNPVIYINLGFNSNVSMSDKMISKKDRINTTKISQVINTSFDYTSNFETKDNITKILCQNSSFTPTEISSADNYMIVEGKLLTSLIYEVNNNELCIKEVHDCFNIKIDVEATNLTRENILDVCFSVDKSYDNISIELEDGNSIITVTDRIKVKGIALQPISVEIIEDIYSCENEIETNSSNREYIEHQNHKNLNETVFGEISLTNQETAIDEMVSNQVVNIEITNTYIKDSLVYIEGIISSSFVYIDENKEYKQKTLDLPFVINTKLEEEKLPCNYAQIAVVSQKLKVKRGTIIEIEYEISVDCHLYKTNNKEIIDNVVIGKSLNFSNYDYQIFIAKPNETMWELCKRIKALPEDLLKLNKDLPESFNGGEKIIIKR